MKRIVYAPFRCQVGDLNFQRVYDIPCRDSIIEAGEPVATLLDSHKNLNILQENIRGSFGNVIGALTPLK